MDYSIIFAAAEPAAEDTVNIHVFSVRFQADDLIQLEDEQLDLFIDNVIEAVLEARDKRHLLEHVAQDTVHVCEGELCPVAQVQLAVLQGQLEPEDAALALMAQNQRNEA